MLWSGNISNTNFSASVYDTNFPVTTVENKIDPGKVWKATVQAYIDSRVGFLHADMHTKSLEVIIN